MTNDFDDASASRSEKRCLERLGVTIAVFRGTRSPRLRDDAAGYESACPEIKLIEYGYNLL